MHIVSNETWRFEVSRLLRSSKTGQSKWTEYMCQPHGTLPPPSRLSLKSQVGD